MAAPHAPPLPAVTIRAAGHGDAAALRSFFHGLSERTRLLRFFAPVMPTAAMLGRLAGGGGVDAVIAVADGAVVGHAMAADEDEPGGDRSSDIGVVVADRWQGRGVGSALMRVLAARAEQRGVTCLTMDVLHGNDKVLAMIAAHWPAARTARSRECTTVLAPVTWRERYPAGFSQTETCWRLSLVKG